MQYEINIDSFYARLNYMYDSVHLYFSHPMNAKVLKTTKLQCIDPIKNQRAYYELDLEERALEGDQRVWCIVQRHGRLGGKHPRSAGFNGIPIPAKNPYYMSLDLAEVSFSETIESKLRSRRRRYSPSS